MWTSHCFPQAVDGLCVRVGDRALVLVGSRKPSSRQRFTLAHELAHYLLMPEPGVRAAIEGLADDAERAVRVARTFGTSVSAAAYKLGNLGLLPDGVRDRLAEAGSRPLLMRYALPSDWQEDESGRIGMRGSWPLASLGRAGWSAHRTCWFGRSGCGWSGRRAPSRSIGRCWPAAGGRAP
jgi:IrrE N-terminal-like domain